MSTAHQTHEMTATHHSGVDQKRGAILVSFLAMFLAIVTLGGNNAAKEATQSNILASNFYSFYQAKNIRQTVYKIASDQLELELLNDKLSATSRAASEKCPARPSRSQPTRPPPRTTARSKSSSANPQRKFSARRKRVPNIAKPGASPLRHSASA